MQSISSILSGQDCSGTKTSFQWPLGDTEKVEVGVEEEEEEEEVKESVARSRSLGMAFLCEGRLSHGRRMKCI